MIKKNRLLISFAAVVFILVSSIAVPAGAGDPVHDRLDHAMRLAHSGQFREAIDEVHSVMREAGADDIGPHLSLGLIYFRMKQYDNALAEFNTVITLNPEDPMSHYFLALIYESRALDRQEKAVSIELKKKAIDAWEKFILFQSRRHGPPPPRHIDVKAKHSIDTAKKHLKILKEEIKE
jgi:tetratricopeptide (TPR) repeat protein